MRWVAPLDKFGGWLRVFQVWTAFGVLAQAVLIWGRFFSGIHGQTPSFSIVLFLNFTWRLVAIVVGIWIIVRLTRKEPTTPSFVARLVIVGAAVQIVFAVLIGSLAQVRVGALALALMNNALAAAIWVEYFRVSKRVRAVYGANAFVPRAVHV